MAEPKREVTPEERDVVRAELWRWNSKKHEGVSQAAIVDAIKSTTGVGFTQQTISKVLRGWPGMAFAQRLAETRDPGRSLATMVQRYRQENSVEQLVAEIDEDFSKETGTASPSRALSPAEEARADFLALAPSNGFNDESVLERIKQRDADKVGDDVDAWIAEYRRLDAVAARMRAQAARPTRAEDLDVDDTSHTVAGEIRLPSIEPSAGDAIAAHAARPRSDEDTLTDPGYDAKKAKETGRRPRPTVASSPSAIAAKTSGDSKPRVVLSHNAADTEKVRAILIAAGVSSVAANRLTDDHVHQIQEAEGLRGGPRWESMARVAAQLVLLDDAEDFVGEAASGRSATIRFAEVVATAERRRAATRGRHIAVGDADEIIESAKKPRPSTRQTAAKERPRQR